MPAAALSSNTPINDLVPLRKATTWSRVRVVELGLLDISRDDRELLDSEVVVLGDTESLSTFMRDPETGRRIKGHKVWTQDGEVRLLGGDTRVRETFGARPAGHPKDVAGLALDGVEIEDSHPFLSEPAGLSSAVLGWEDAESAIETLLWAIPVAPAEVVPVLHAALARSYDEMLEFYEEFDDEPRPKWNAEGHRKKRR